MLVVTPDGTVGICSWFVLDHKAPRAGVTSASPRLEAKPSVTGPASMTVDILIPSLCQCHLPRSESWHGVGSTNGRIEASSLGNIRRRMPDGLTRPLTPFAGTDGYLFVTLRQSDCGVQRRVNVAHLVAEAHLGPRPEGQYVCHLDDRKTHNCSTNLVYGTARENTQHAKTNGRFPLGERHGRSKLSADQVRRLRAAHAAGQSKRSLAREYGIHEVAVTKIITRRSWGHVA